MKDLIRKILKEETEEVLNIPSLSLFSNGVESLREFLKVKNIKRWSFGDDLNLFKYEGDMSFLHGLVSVKGYLFLEGTSIESLGNLEYVGNFLYLEGSSIKSLGNLKHVGGFLDLKGSSIKSLGNLEYVGRHFYLNKILSEKYTNQEIRSQVNVLGEIIRL